MTLVMICSGRMYHKIVVQILKMERTLCNHRKKIYNTVYNTIFALNLFEISRKRETGSVHHVHAYGKWDR